MFDPSIQTFCCRKPGVVNPSVSTLSELNSSTYNYVCLISSILGCMGAIYQLLPRNGTQPSRRWYSLTSLRGTQIVIWLAVADLNAALGVLLRSIVKLNSPQMFTRFGNQNLVLCVVLAGWIEYFYMVTWVWTLFYAIDTWLALNQKPGMPKLYHSLAWSIPAVLTSVGLAILYYPDADCHNYSMKTASSLSDVVLHLLPNYLITYFFICTVMVLCPFFYFISAREVDHVVANCLSQVTRKERSVVQAVRLRFGLITLSFYACWLPNLISGIIIWSSWYNLPRTAVITLWYIMAVMNPLQALFNSFVYRRSNVKVVLPFKRTANEETPLIPSNINT